MKRPIIHLAGAAVLIALIWGLPACARAPMPLPTLASMMLALVQLSFTIGLGLAVLHRTRCPVPSPLGEGGLACFLGVGTLGFATLLLGLAGHCSALELRVLMTILAVVTWPLTAQWLRRFGPAARPWRGEIPALVVGGVLFALLLLHAALPPLAYDVLEYHLAVPRIWMRAGEITPVAGNLFSHQPFTAELNFMLSLALGNDALPSVPKLFNVAGLAAALSLVLAFAIAKGLGRGVRGPAALLVLATPLIFRISTDALVDIWVVLGVLAAIHTWHRWVQRRHFGALFVAALCLGFLVTIKHTALAFWVVPILGLFLWTILAHRLCPPEWIMSALALLTVALLPVIPWWVKEWAWTGNPIYPLGYGLFGGEGWSEAQARLLVGGHGLRSPLGGDFWISLWHRLDVFGPCVLSATVGVIVLARRRHIRGLVGPTLVTGIAAMLLWNLLGGGADRFMAPAVALMIPLGMGGLWTAVVWCRGWFGRAQARWGTLAALAPVIEMALRIGGGHFEFTMYLSAVAITLLLPLMGRRAMPSRLVGWAALVPAALLALLVARGEFILGDETPVDRLAWVMGQSSRGEVTRGFWHIQAFKYLNEIEHPEGEVLLVYEARTFNLDAPAVCGTVFDGQPLREFVRGAESLDQVFERLRAAGISHVMVNRAEAHRLMRFYFGLPPDAPLTPDTVRPLWDFPAPLTEAEYHLMVEFDLWAAESAQFSRGGLVSVARLPE
ncbi:glycosyltransferase family 39 protein [Candidatus Sumerlaeota bacterium]|nr:glycosyltransferase family 39 protein [Candidatus Sumerlaeota bacterium]